MTLLKNLYFVTRGERPGQFWLLLALDEVQKVYTVLAFPECDPMYVTEKDISAAIVSKQLELVDNVPDEVFLECQSEFQYRLNSK